MVQILQAKPRKETGSADAFMQAFATGLEGYSQAQQQKQFQQQMMKENEAVKRNFGIDLSGINNPDQRKLIIGEMLKGQQKKMLQQEKQEFLDKLFGGGTLGEGAINQFDGEEVGLSEGMKGLNTPAKQMGQGKSPVDFSKISDSDIVRASLIDPELGRSLRAAKDSILNANKSSFEPESDKLEAKRVAELATSIEKDFSTAKMEDIRLERMEKLSEKGDVSTPLLLKALDTVGLPIGVLSNPDTEEYRKLETDFIRDARDIFPGGRITNYEIQSYLKTIPSLMNSPEGRKAIIRNRKLFNEAKRIRYEEYKNLIKENGGKKPLNMGLLLEERTADKIGKIEEEFRNGIDSEINKFQQPIRMVDPNGRPIDVPPNMIEKAMKAGARFQ